MRVALSPVVIFNCFLCLFGSNGVALHILDRFSEIPPHASLVPVDLHWWDVLVQSQSNDVWWDVLVQSQLPRIAFPPFSLLTSYVAYTAQSGLKVARVSSGLKVAHVSKF